MSRINHGTKWRQGKPLLPMEFDELPFIQQPHTPILAEEVGIVPAPTAANTVLPPLWPMDNDELPFGEQGYTPISAQELAQATPAQVTATVFDHEGFFVLESMDEDELPFVEQPHVAISLAELNTLAATQQRATTPQAASAATPTSPCMEQFIPRTVDTHIGAEDGTRKYTANPGRADRKYRKSSATYIVRIEICASKRIYPSRSCTRYSQTRFGKRRGSGCAGSISYRARLRGLAVCGRPKRFGKREA